MNRLKVDVVMGWMLIVLLLVVEPMLIFYEKTNKSATNYNYQTDLSFANNHITNLKTYIENGEVKTEFFILDQEKTEAKSGFIPYVTTLKTPIAYKAYATNTKGVDKYGAYTGELKNGEMLSEGFIKNGVFSLTNDVEKVKSSKYLTLILNDTDEVEKTNQKQSIVILDTNNLLDFIDVSDYINDQFRLEKDKNLKNKYAKWMYTNEVNAELLSIFIKEKGQENYDITPKNVLDFTNKMLENNTKTWSKVAQNNFILENYISRYSTNSKGNEFIICRKITNLPMFIDYKKIILSDLSSVSTRLLGLYVPNLKEQKDINNMYEKVKDYITDPIRLWYLMSLNCPKNEDAVQNNSPI